MSNADYKEPLALIIISSISIGVAAIFSAYIAFDILWRRGWRSMMAIMIPVYIINALYLWPITLWTYLKYSRPEKPPSKEQVQHEHQLSQNSSQTEVETQQNCDSHGSHNDHGDHEHNHDSHKADVEGHDSHEGHNEHAHHHGGDRPIFATVTIGVCHCGAGCVLGDIIGEWIVYATGATIGSPPRGLWVNYLVDFAFAFAFGIVFQYFSIAPMAGKWGPKIVLRALQADALSLLFFEIGLFGWMAIFQIAIWNWRLEMNTVTYWWMMQVGMFFGHWTGVPINWWLIKKGIKEPCA